MAGNGNPPPPMFVVTTPPNPAGEVDGSSSNGDTPHLSHASNGTTVGGSTRNNGNSNSNNDHYPPSPSTSSHDESSSNGHGKSNTLARPDNSRVRGHSPTKSVDSAFHSYLEKASHDASAKQKSSTSKHPTFTALDGPRAEKQELDASGAGRDLESSVGAGAGGKVVKTGKRKGFLGKIPLLKRLAPMEEAEEQEESEDVVAAKRQGKVVAVIPDPSAAEMGKFNPLVPSTLNHLIDPKNLNHLTDLGGEEGLVAGLHSDKHHGLSEKSAATGTSLEDRKRVYGENKIPQRPPKSLLALMWAAFQDKVLVSTDSLQLARAVWRVGVGSALQQLV